MHLIKCKDSKINRRAQDFKKQEEKERGSRYSLTFKEKDPEWKRSTKYDLSEEKIWEI